MKVIKPIENIKIAVDALMENIKKIDSRPADLGELDRQLAEIYDEGIVELRKRLAVYRRLRFPDVDLYCRKHGERRDPVRRPRTVLTPMNATEPF